MTKEDIEKAASKFTEEGEKNACWSQAESKLCHDGFVDGAIWHMSSIWHDFVDFNDIPKSEVVFILRQDGYIVEYDEYLSGIKRLEPYIPVVKWAYMKDLTINIERRWE